MISYQLVGVTATRTYGGNIGGDPTGANAVLPGTAQVSLDDRNFTSAGVTTGPLTTR